MIDIAMNIFIINGIILWRKELINELFVIISTPFYDTLLYRYIGKIREIINCKQKFNKGDFLYLIIQYSTYNKFYIIYQKN